MATTPSPFEFLQAYRPKATAAAKAVSSRSRERPFPELQVICVSPLETGGGSDRDRVTLRAVDCKGESSETQSQRQQRVSCRQKKNPIGEAYGVCEHSCRLLERVEDAGAEPAVSHVDPRTTEVAFLQVLHEVDRAGDVLRERVLDAHTVRQPRFGLTPEEHPAELHLRLGKPDQAVEVHGTDVGVGLGEQAHNGGLYLVGHAARGAVRLVLRQ